MKNPYSLVGFLAVMALLFMGCGTVQTQAQTDQNATSTQKQDLIADQEVVPQDKLAEDTALSNPATVYCLEQGGKFTLSKSFDGSTEGVCTLQNNISCEVWAHYKGDCPVGAKKKATEATTTKTVVGETTSTKDVAVIEDKTLEDKISETQKEDDGTELPLTEPETATTLSLIAEPGEDEGEIVTTWRPNGQKAPDGFIVMLSGQEQVSYPTKYFHALKNPDSRSFIWSGLVPERTYFFRVCIADGDSCKTYSQVVNSLPK